MNDQSKKNITLDDSTDEIMNFDDLEMQLESKLKDEMAEFQFLQSEQEQIGNPDALGSTIKNVVWEQLLDQIAVTAGVYFIKAKH